MLHVLKPIQFSLALCWLGFPFSASHEWEWDLHLSCLDEFLAFLLSCCTTLSLHIGIKILRARSEADLRNSRPTELRFCRYLFISRKPPWLMVCKHEEYVSCHLEIVACRIKLHSLFLGMPQWMLSQQIFTLYLCLELSVLFGVQVYRAKQLLKLVFFTLEIWADPWLHGWSCWYLPCFV